MEQTAVEWLFEQLDIVQGYENAIKIRDQAKEMEKQRMIDLVQQLKDYTKESRNVLGFDEREACEFVEIFTNQTFKSE
jgi:thioredoxin-related protein